MNHIAIASVNKDQYSETFIHDQVKNLPAEVTVLHGGYLPNLADGKLIAGYDSDKGLVRQKMGAVLNQATKVKIRKGLVDYLRSNKIELVIAHYGPCGVEMVEVCEAAGIPLFVYFHGYDVYRKEELKRFGPEYKKVFEKAANIFSVSSDMTARLCDLGCPVEKITYNPCGVNTENFVPPLVNSGSNQFAAVGRLVEKKGFSVLLQAFAAVVDQIPDAHLKIAGDGPLQKSLIKLTRKLGLGEKVEFVGRLSREDILLLLQNSFAFVQPSVVAHDGDCDGTPVTLLEAGSCGLPLIGSDIAGISDVIDSGSNGFLVDPGNAEELAASMIYMLKKRTLAKKMGGQARSTIVQSFNLEDSLEKLWQCCKEQLTSPAS